VEQDLAVVEEVHLEQFVAESEHDGVSCLQPLLDVNKLVIGLEFNLLHLHFLHLLVKVNDEALEEQVLFLEVSVFGHGISLIGLDAFLLEGGVLDEVDVSE
jgi:hypothetical protein